MALTRKGLIIAAKESTYGTDATPAGTDAIKVANINITPLQSDVVSRQIIRPFSAILSSCWRINASSSLLMWS
jgi:hypothetical protein